MKKKRTIEEIEERHRKRLTKRFVLLYGVKNYYNKDVKKRLEYYSKLLAIEFKIEYKDLDSFLLRLYEVNPYSKISRYSYKDRFKKIKSPKNKFYISDEWVELRGKVLSFYGKTCMKCGSTKNIHVDHIYPISKFPELKLSFDNLQVLCSICNIQKSNIDYTDYRPLVN